MGHVFTGHVTFDSDEDKKEMASLLLDNCRSVQCCVYSRTSLIHSCLNVILCSIRKSTSEMRTPLICTLDHVTRVSWSCDQSECSPPQYRSKLTQQFPQNNQPIMSCVLLLSLADLQLVGADSACSLDQLEPIFLATAVKYNCLWGAELLLTHGVSAATYHNGR